MTWVKLDTGFFADAKVAELRNPSEIVLYVAGLCHCGSNLTDGVIAMGAMRNLLHQAFATDAAAESLCAIGLWRNHPDGYEVVGFLKHQTSREQVEQQRESARVRRSKRQPF